MVFASGTDAFFVFLGMLFHKIGQNGRPGRREPRRSTSFDGTSRMVSVWVSDKKMFFVIFVTCRSRVICKKSRVTERHNRGTKRTLKSHQAQKKALRAFFGAGGATSIFALCPDCAAP